MLQRHNDEHGHDMILVSQTGIVGFILFCLTMTGLLMGLFMFVDFDSILGRKHLAMKVGQTSISVVDFKKIKEISGTRAAAMPDQAWAEELFETLILAEDARKLMLDQNPDLKTRVQTFNLALNKGEDEERIARSIFLHEELAKASIDNMLAQNSEYQKLISSEEKQAETTNGLHLRMITVADRASLDQLQAEIASGADISAINASYSISPYRGVGGDIGWKSEKDLPEGLFARLSNASGTELIEGFADETGIHLYSVISRTDITRRFGQEKQRKELKKRLISQHVLNLRNTVEFWVNPSLKTMCQITPISDAKNASN
ncbi:MAG: peptidylprolyl isomerase [Candidatus Rifleibacteriota bacterium]